MSTLNIPVTATNMVEWVRRCATAVNELIRRLAAVESRVSATEAADAAIATRVTAAEAAITTLDAFAAAPFTVTSITFTPVTLPGSPADGLTVLDSADNIVKTYAAGSWHLHY